VNLHRSAKALCGVTAAAALFSIMALTLVDVAGRKLLSTSVPGSLEMTELLMVVVIFASLPLVALGGEHVAFDSLDAKLPEAVRRWQRRVVELLCAAALAGVAWLTWSKAGQMSEAGDITAQLKLPLGAFVYGMSVLIFAAALAHLVMAWQPPDASAGDGLEEGGAL
jgi:TRAP-type transport system small permease protein